MADSQLTAGKSVTNRGPMVLVRPLSAPNPNYSGTNQPVSLVRDLTSYISLDVIMQMHVITTVRPCFSALWQLHGVQRLSQHALLTFIRALVVSKVDYCCSMPVGVCDQLLDRLQSVLNAAACLIEAF